MANNAQVIPIRVQMLSNTTAGWAADVASSNPTIPEFGEIVCEDTGAAPKFKGGDGIHNFSGLSYLTSGLGTPEALQDVLNIGNSATQGGGNTGIFTLTDTTSGIVSTFLAKAISIANSTYKSIFNVSNFSITTAANVLIAALNTAGGGGYIQLLDSSGSGFYSILLPSLLGATRNNYLPDRSGLLQLSGDQVNPAKALGPGAGTGATAVFSATSDDRSGTITLTPGSTPTAGTVVLQVTFSQPYATKTRVIAQIINGNPALSTDMFISSESTTGFSITANHGLSISAATYVITYIVQN